MAMPHHITVIGVGNEFRRDDGAGPSVVARLRERAVLGALPTGIRLVCCGGEPGRLIELWAGAALAVVVDAALALPGHPGRIHRLEPCEYPIRYGGAASSHGLGLGSAVELARALDRTPGCLVVYAIEGADGSPGTGLTPAVAASVGPLAERIEKEITQYLARAQGEA
ncbi:hydrogenase maturation protease [Streptomyces sp. NPDC095613]|uniref:hydrogenase maturation protease n=1 Tax=Streptomyces sp. NPDC095613 TaxID=3155540 RepID=UPI00332D1C6D